MDDKERQELRDAFDQVVRRWTYKELIDAQHDLQNTLEMVEDKLNAIKIEVKNRRWTFEP